MNRRLIAIGLILPVICAVLVAAGANTSQPAESPFSGERFTAHVRYLASDELEGRLPGTPGIEKAAEYIAEQFQLVGLSPAGDEATYFQTFEVRRGKRLEETEARLEIVGVDGRPSEAGGADQGQTGATGQPATYKVRRDWIPLPFTDMQDVEGPVAFAGYGIDSETYDYNDYDGFDAKGKILLIFRHEPRSDDPNAEFGGKEPSRCALFSQKVRMAARHGAKALLVVNPPHPDEKDTLYAFDEELTQRTFDLPLVQVTRELAAALLRPAGLPSLADLQDQLDKQRESRSADLKLSVRLKTGVHPNVIPTRNVVGLLPGTDAALSTIVVGAHYDHLGRVHRQFDMNDPAPVIHNGADDNASGTAGVIELARVLAADRGLRRNVMFVAFSAEEMGLLGSKHFVDHPPVPRSEIRAMVNFDMIGRLSADKFTVYGIPSAPEFAALVEQAGTHAGLKYRAAPGVPDNSDQAAFYRRDIPVLFAFTGVHKQYHRPEDDTELTDGPGAARVLDMFAEVVRSLANLTDGPTFQEVTAKPEAEDLEMKPAVEHEKDADRPAGSQPAREGGEARKGERDGEVEKPMMPGVRLGIIPDFSGGSEPGVVADSVLDGPAKVAGMKDGDRIVKIGDQQIKDIYGYMSVLKSFKAGDKLDVVVVREGKEQTLHVELKAAPRAPREPQ